jgi:hypothetical protein
MIQNSQLLALPTCSETTSMADPYPKGGQILHVLITFTRSGPEHSPELTGFAHGLTPDDG